MAPSSKRGKINSKPSTSSSTPSPLKGLNKNQKGKENARRLTRTELEAWSNRLEAEEQRLKEAKDQWTALSTKLNSALLPNRIKLDVGGTIFAISKDALLAQKDNFFGAMFGGRFEPKPEPDGTYFIDRNPTFFHLILDYLRGNPIVLENFDISQLDLLRTEAEFYHLEDLIQHIDRWNELQFPQSAILQGMESLNETLAEWTGHKRWKLQYRGSQHGFANADFHTRCDEKGESLVICKDESGFVYGAYSSVGWEDLDESFACHLGAFDRKAFVFSLINPERTEPIQFKFQAEEVDDADYMFTVVCWGRTHGPSLCMTTESLMPAWNYRNKTMEIDTKDLFKYFKDPNNFNGSFCINYETFHFTDCNYDSNVGSTMDQCTLTEIEVFVVDEREED